MDVPDAVPASGFRGGKHVISKYREKRQITLYCNAAERACFHTVNDDSARLVWDCRHLGCTAAGVSGRGSCDSSGYSGIL